MRREVNALGWRVGKPTSGNTSVRRKSVSQYRIFSARGWHSQAALAGLIASVPLMHPVSASGQSMSHDMPGMEHEHHGTAPATQQPSPPAPNAQQLSPAKPDVAREAPVSAPATTPEQGAMPAMEHGGHEMGGMQHMKGQFGPYPMSREASGTAWNPDSTPQQGMMFMSGDWMLMGHANLFGVYDDQGGPRGASKTFAAGMVM